MNDDSGYFQILDQAADGCMFPGRQGSRRPVVSGTDMATPDFHVCAGQFHVTDSKRSLYVTDDAEIPAGVFRTGYSLLQTDSKPVSAAWPPVLYFHMISIQLLPDATPASHCPVSIFFSASGRSSQRYLLYSYKVKNGITHITFGNHSGYCLADTGSPAGQPLSE